MDDSGVMWFLQIQMVQRSPCGALSRNGHSPVYVLCVCVCVCVCAFYVIPRGTHTHHASGFYSICVCVVLFYFLALKVCEVVFAMLSFQCTNLRRYSGNGRVHPDPANSKTDSSLSLCVCVCVCVCSIFMESKHTQINLPWQRVMGK